MSNFNRQTYILQNVIAQCNECIDSIKVVAFEDTQNQLEDYISKIEDISQITENDVESFLILLARLVNLHGIFLDKVINIFKNKAPVFSCFNPNFVNIPLNYCVSVIFLIESVNFERLSSEQQYGCLIVGLMALSSINKHKNEICNDRLKKVMSKQIENILYRLTKTRKTLIIKAETFCNIVEASQEQITSDKSLLYAILKMTFSSQISNLSSEKCLIVWKIVNIWVLTRNEEMFNLLRLFIKTNYDSNRTLFSSLPLNMKLKIMEPKNIWPEHIYNDLFLILSEESAKRKYIFARHEKNKLYNNVSLDFNIIN